MLETDDGITLNTFSLKDVIGRPVICEDGVCRKVEQISYSHKYADCVLINEVNEDETPGGAWVHVLSLACQMHGKPLPTMEQKKAFSGVTNALRFVPQDEIDKKANPGYFTTPSGIIVKK